MPKTPKLTSPGKEGEIILPRNGHHTDDGPARPGARLRQQADTATPQDALIDLIAEAHRKPPPGGPNKYPPHLPKALFRSRPSTPHEQEAIWRNWLAAGPVLAHYGVPRKLLEQIGFPLGGDPEDLYGCHPAMPDSPEYFGNLDYHVQYLFLRERKKYEDRIEQLRQERDEWRLKCVSQRTL